jgi:cyanophycin synthetase
LGKGSEEIRVCRLGDVPVIGKQKEANTIANVLAGIAAGWAMNLSLEVITTGAKTFGLELTDPAALLPQRNKKPLPAKKPAARN